MEFIVPVIVVGIFIVAIFIRAKINDKQRQERMRTNSCGDFKECKDRSFKRKRLICGVICSVLVIGTITSLCIIRERKLRRAFLSLENLTFDEMEFVRCTDNELIDTFDHENSKIICKTTNGDWTIRLVDGCEENLEYVYVRSFMDGYYYERVK